jgi:hypothetical protein
MQPGFRSIFRCYLLSPFVTLSAGRKNGSSKPRLYDEVRLPEGKLHTIASLTG